MKLDHVVAVAALRAKVPDAVAARVVEEYLSAVRDAVESQGAYVMDDFLLVRVKRVSGNAVKVGAAGCWWRRT